MNKNSFLQQKNKTGYIDANLKLRQHKLVIMVRFMEFKSINPNMKQKEIAKERGYSIGKLQRHRNDIIMLSPYENPQNLIKEDKNFQLQILLLIQIVNMISKNLA